MIKKPNKRTGTETASQGNRKRALVKIAVILGIIALVIFGLTHFINGQQLDELKHNIDLGLLITLLVIINLVSFACFLVLFAAYQWVREDLKSKRGGHDN